MSFRSQAFALLEREGHAALVTLSRVQGSSPREAGAQMLVTASGFIGSIGGGTLEWQAMAEAQSILSSFPRFTIPQDRHPPLHAEDPLYRNSKHKPVGGPLEAGHDGKGCFSAKVYSLGPDLGQCCGGRVTVTTRLIATAIELEAALIPEQPQRHILLYGAGHVGKALILMLAQSPFAVTWVDPRPSAFPSVVPTNVVALNTDSVLEPLSHIRRGTLVIVMSHSHELDFAVTDAALRNPSVAHVLLIGSDTKRARFLSRLKTAGHADEALARLICPIGDGTLSGKTPYAVALSTAHQLLAIDEALALRGKDTGQEKQKESQAG